MSTFITVELGLTLFGPKVEQPLTRAQAHIELREKCFGPSNTYIRMQILLNTEDSQQREAQKHSFCVCTLDTLRFFLAVALLRCPSLFPFQVQSRPRV